jgi:tetratricopeptide (TPR) repeat protein
LSDAITLDPNTALAYVLRGRAQLAGAFLDRALADAERALTLDAENLAALDLIAEIHSRRGSVAEAIAAYEEMLRARPTDVRSAVALARIHLEAENPAAALQVLEPFADQAVDNPVLTETLFTAHHRLHNDNEALGYLQHYVNARPNDPILLLELVETALALPGQTRLSAAEIVGHAERALDLSGGFRTEYRIALIDALIAAGDRERALEQTMRALEDVPNNPDLRERRRQLE